MSWIFQKEKIIHTGKEDYGRTAINNHFCTTAISNQRSTKFGCGCFIVKILKENLFRRLTSNQQSNC